MITANRLRAKREASLQQAAPSHPSAIPWHEHQRLMQDLRGELHERLEAAESELKVGGKFDADRLAKVLAENLTRANLAKLAQAVEVDADGSRDDVARAVARAFE